MHINRKINGENVRGEIIHNTRTYCHICGNKDNTIVFKMRMPRKRRYTICVVCLVRYLISSINEESMAALSAFCRELKDIPNGPDKDNDNIDNDSDNTDITPKLELEATDSGAMESEQNESDNAQAEERSKKVNTKRATKAKKTK